MAERIQLSRRKGWRMPENAVSVARPGPWGNPFIVGKHGNRAECVRLHLLLMGGLITMGLDNHDAQVAHREHVVRHREELRGRDLACWCSLDGPCHADTLIEVANG